MTVLATGETRCLVYQQMHRPPSSFKRAKIIGALMSSAQCSQILTATRCRKKTEGVVGVPWATPANIGIHGPNFEPVDMLRRICDM